MMFTLLVLVLAQVPVGEDAPTLIQRVIDAQEHHQRAQREYAFRERTVTRHLDKRGATTETEDETFFVAPTVGGEYRRLVAKDGRPLSAVRAADEEKKLERHLREQQRLTPEEREQRTREKLEKRIERYQTRLEEAMEAYNFEPLPDDVVSGERVRVFRFAPKPGYEGRSRPTKVFARMEGKVWIDPERDQLAKLSIELIRDLTFLGGLFGRISAGTRATIDAELRDGLWMLDRAEVSLNARLYFLKRYRRDITVDYDDYRKYRVDIEEELRPAPTTSGR